MFHSVVLGVSCVSQPKSFRCLSQAVPPRIRFCCSTHASGDFSHFFQQFCLLWHVISPEEGAHTFPSRGSALHLSCSRWPAKIQGLPLFQDLSPRCSFEQSSASCFSCVKMWQDQTLHVANVASSARNCTRKLKRGIKCQNKLKQATGARTSLSKHQVKEKVGA